METPEKSRTEQQESAGGTPETQQDHDDPEQSDDKVVKVDTDDETEEESPKTRDWLYFLLLVLVVAGATVFVVMFLVNKDKLASPYQEVGSNADEVDDDLFAPIMPVAPTGPVAPIFPVVRPTELPSSPPPTTPRTASPVTSPPTASSPITSPPTSSPVTFAPTLSPTKFPTRSPTEAPLVDFTSEITAELANAGTVVDTASDPTAAAAVQWLSDEFSSLDDAIVVAEYNQNLPQRFAMLSLEMRLSGDPNERADAVSMVATPNLHVCFWEGVSCGTSTTSVQSIEWGSRGLSGTIGTEISTLVDLEHFDVHNNNIGGVIPEQLYTLVNLTVVYLYKNDISGTISSRIGDLWKLRTWHSSHNRLTGSIPAEIRSGDVIRPLREYSFRDVYVSNEYRFVWKDLFWNQSHIRGFFAFLIIL
jgi:hypothetical protein